MIIGITGKKFAGKDVVADYLIRQHGFVKYKFASPIKNFVADTFLMSDSQINGDQKEVVDERWGMSGREIQQVFGTETMREFFPTLNKTFNEIIGNNLWCKRFQYWYESLPKGADVVISDVRFLNEFKILKEMGGHILKIKREGLVSTDQHSSEQEMDQIIPDYTLHNDSGIEGLEAKIAMVYPQIYYKDV